MVVPLACSDLRGALPAQPRACLPGRASVAARARRLPESGYFSDADPNAEVRSPLAGVDNKDALEKGSRSDFIWNTNWKERLDYLDALKQAREENKAKGPQAAAGGLRLTSLAELNSLDTDLSEQLRPRAASAAQQPSALALIGRSATQRNDESPAQRVQRQRAELAAGQRARQRAFAAVPASKDEARRWQRSSRFTRKVVPSAASQEELAAQRAAAAAERDQYEALKVELQLWCLGATAMGCAAALAFYTRDVAASYGVGALGGFVYLRLLNRSVDAVGGFSLAASGSSARLLIPVILALSYNRWNVLEGDTTGVHLQLLPMLLGFFTYKAAVIAKQALTLLGELSGSAGALRGGGDALQPPARGGAPSMDEQLARRVLTR